MLAAELTPLPYLTGLLRELYPCARRAARQRAAHVYYVLARGVAYRNKRVTPQNCEVTQWHKLGSGEIREMAGQRLSH